jgi:hypothetical protein
MGASMYVCECVVCVDGCISVLCLQICGVCGVCVRVGMMECVLDWYVDMSM